jgi:hypothetical protein
MPPIAVTAALITLSRNAVFCTRKNLSGQCGLTFERLIFSRLFSCSLACQSLFHTLLLARLQVIGMTLHFFDDVFRLNLTFEATKGVLQRLALLQSNFCQTRHHRSAPTIGANFSLLHLQCCKRFPSTSSRRRKHAPTKFTAQWLPTRPLLRYDPQTLGDRVFSMECIIPTAPCCCTRTSLQTTRQPGWIPFSLSAIVRLYDRRSLPPGSFLTGK